MKRRRLLVSGSVGFALSGDTSAVDILVVMRMKHAQATPYRRFRDRDRMPLGKTVESFVQEH